MGNVVELVITTGSAICNVYCWAAVCAGFAESFAVIVKLKVPAVVG